MKENNKILQLIETNNIELAIQLCKSIDIDINIIFGDYIESLFGSGCWTCGSMGI